MRLKDIYRASTIISVALIYVGANSLMHRSRVLDYALCFTVGMFASILMCIIIGEVTESLSLHKDKVAESKNESESVERYSKEDRHQRQAKERKPLNIGKKIKVCFSAIGNFFKKLWSKVPKLQVSFVTSDEKLIVPPEISNDSPEVHLNRC